MSCDLKKARHRDNRGWPWTNCHCMKAVKQKKIRPKKCFRFFCPDTGAKLQNILLYFCIAIHARMLFKESSSSCALINLDSIPTEAFGVFLFLRHSNDITYFTSTFTEDPAGLRFGLGMSHWNHFNFLFFHNSNIDFGCRRTWKIFLSVRSFLFAIIVLFVFFLTVLLWYWGNTF